YVLDCCLFFFFFQAEDGIRDFHVTGVQTCALPIMPDTARWLYSMMEAVSKAGSHSPWHAGHDAPQPSPDPVLVTSAPAISTTHMPTTETQTTPLSPLVMPYPRLPFPRPLSCGHDAAPWREASASWGVLLRLLACGSPPPERILSPPAAAAAHPGKAYRSEEHTSELQSRE